MAAVDQEHADDWKDPVPRKPRGVEGGTRRDLRMRRAYLISRLADIDRELAKPERDRDAIASSDPARFCLASTVSPPDVYASAYCNGYRRCMSDILDR
jgi:hypothetical protein